MTLLLPPTFTRTIVCSGFVGPSDPHPRQTFGTSHRRMTGRDAGGPEDAVPLRPPDFGLTPPPERGLHGRDTVGPGAYPPLSAQIPPVRGLHVAPRGDTVGPGGSEPRAAPSSMSATTSRGDATPTLFHLYQQRRSDLGRDRVRMLSCYSLQYIRILVLLVFTQISPYRPCCAQTYSTFWRSSSSHSLGG